jgi:protein-S-isoprenylcysteine O-methyltransferase Ste14
MTQTAPNRFPWPPVIYLAGIAVAAGLGILYPLPWIRRPVSDLLFAAGWLGVAMAILVFVAAIRTMMRARTTIRPDRPSGHLVTSGPFSFTRNPIYLADTVLLVSIGLIAGNAWFLPLALVAAFITQKVTIESEEKHLSERFGKKYRDYTKRVRRWI